jgi:hypothetical protein
MSYPAGASECFICGRILTQRSERTDPNGAFRYRCLACLEYCLASNFTRTPPQLDDRNRRAISAGCRQAAGRGAPLTLDLANWPFIAEKHLNVPVPQKLQLLLDVLASKTEPGEFWHWQDFDYLLVDAKNVPELDFLVSSLVTQGWVERSADGQPRLTASGWAKVNSFGPENGTPGRCFVAMAFHPSSLDAYTNGIRPAVENDCGLTSIQMLDVEHNDKICDRIIVEIRRAQFVIADFTFHRGGVYFEAGFAHALGRPVIWTCNARDFDGLHFDTRQYNHIKWQDAVDLRKQLAARIRGTIPGARLT